MLYCAMEVHYLQTTCEDSVPFSPPLTDFALCFEAPLPSNSPASNCRSTTSNTLSGPSEHLPKLFPGDNTPFNTSSPTPVFQTPPSGGPPLSYVHPNPKLHSATSSSDDLPPPSPPPSVQPNLDSGSLKITPVPCTRTKQGVPPDSSDSASSSGSSFLTPGTVTILHVALLVFSLESFPLYGILWSILSYLKYGHLSNQDTASSSYLLYSLKFHLEKTIACLGVKYLSRNFFVLC